MQLTCTNCGIEFEGAEDLKELIGAIIHAFCSDACAHAYIKRRIYAHTYN